MNRTFSVLNLTSSLSRLGLRSLCHVHICRNKKASFKHYLHRKKLTPQNMIERVWLVQIYCKVKRFCASVPPEVGKECPNHKSSSLCSESLEAQGTPCCSQYPDMHNCLSYQAVSSSGARTIFQFTFYSEDV